MTPSCIHRTRLALAFALVAALAACGGGDGPTIGPGAEDFSPPPEQVGDGSRPAGATAATCGAAEDCDYWYCQCADGAVVNSALCVNGFCMDAASACPDACAYFDHGAWTGAAGGGPGSSPEPEPEPEPGACGDLGSSDPTCDACFQDACCGEGAACGASAACLAYWDCAVPCGGDPGCRSACDDLYPAGAGTYGALEACLGDRCGSECGGGW